jgi:hypothetical protein
VINIAWRNPRAAKSVEFAKRYLSEVMQGKSMNGPAMKWMTLDLKSDEPMMVRVTEV